MPSILIGDFIPEIKDLNQGLLLQYKSRLFLSFIIIVAILFHGDF